LTSRANPRKVRIADGSDGFAMCSNAARTRVLRRFFLPNWIPLGHGRHYAREES